MKRIHVALIGAALLVAFLTYGLWPEAALDASARADRVLVEKNARKLTLLQNGRVLKVYRVSLGRNPLGRKERQGDSRTPEGNYTLDYRNAQSRFHRALHVSYPNAADVARARQLGVDPGGAIMVHGLQNRLGWLGRWHRLADWTDGCIAVTNREMDELWRAIPDGTPIEIRP